MPFGHRDFTVSESTVMATLMTYWLVRCNMRYVTRRTVGQNVAKLGQD
jgi:hypothetical protein